MHRTGLLVSVRDVQEAMAALDGGADLIDVKEPANGPLGKADDEVIRSIVKSVGGRVPVSAALGEWGENQECPANATLAYVKWGPAGGGRDLVSWERFLRSRLTSSPPQTVLVAYADWECAQAPPLDRVVDLACTQPGSILLIDTHCKDSGSLRRKPTLLDWLPELAVRGICEACRIANVRVALAGSLGLQQLQQLRSARPDWFAVRGAACQGADRTGTISAARVRQIKQVISSGPAAVCRAKGLETT